LEGAEKSEQNKGDSYKIKRGRFVKKGLFFFGLLQRGEGTRNLRGRGVKIENGSKAVNALSFIFTVSVLNSFLAYVTVT